MADATLTPLRRIPTPGGEVRYGMKVSDAGFAGFGEAYFSTVEQGAIKGWKRHNRMTLNLVVAAGEVRFIAFNEASGARRAVCLTPDSPNSYGRLTVPPGLWLAFGGVGRGSNLILNIASIEHDPAEVDSRPVETFAWAWRGDDA